jgi:hypothetical protein
VITSPTVEAEPDDSNTGTFVNAGRWYLALHPYTAKNKPPRAEIPFTFEAGIRGTAKPNVTPESTPAPPATATPTATPTPTAVFEPEADAGPPPTVAAVGGVAGILVGVAAGVARRVRRH